MSTIVHFGLSLLLMLLLFLFGFSDSSSSSGSSSFGRFPIVGSNGCRQHIIAVVIVVMIIILFVKGLLQFLDLLFFQFGLSTLFGLHPKTGTGRKGGSIALGHSHGFESSGFRIDNIIAALGKQGSLRAQVAAAAAGTTTTARVWSLAAVTVTLEIHGVRRRRRMLRQRASGFVSIHSRLGLDWGFGGVDGSSIYRSTLE
mmetsp:Transcript_19549/g.53818  ORF Transcript_19549/g.53818 Transcript_19549/m.53818 type:complete len:200 (-) Transcript_19549:126-725(-)